MSMLHSGKYISYLEFTVDYICRRCFKLFNSLMRLKDASNDTGLHGYCVLPKSYLLNEW